jgi:hypothetical protein
VKLEVLPSSCDSIAETMSNFVCHKACVRGLRLTRMLACARSKEEGLHGVHKRLRCTEHPKT